jgi:CheY-like chemotaxis protein/two-component sensor histidine kinase
MRRLVDDLLDVTRITRNKIELKKEKVELNGLVYRVVENYRTNFADIDVKLEMKLTSEPLFLIADPARLTQVVDNLLHNEVKFTRKGDKTLVTVEKNENTREAVIKVEDNGLGIEPSILPDLFKPFMQVENSIDRSRGGLGLGLAIVKGMVELHGGRVEVYSEGLGCGTTFILHLPIPDNLDTQNNELQVNGQTIPSMRILVIDDIPDIAGIFSTLLTHLGHEVRTASNGREGLTKAKEFLPQVLLCDIGLPGMTGYEVAESFRKDNDLKDVFLIALSGYAQPEDLAKSRAAGFDRHLAKPVDLDTLKDTLAEVPLIKNNLQI